MACVGIGTGSVTGLKRIGKDGDDEHFFFFLGGRTSVVETVTFGRGSYLCRKLKASINTANPLAHR